LDRLVYRYGAWLNVHPQPRGMRWHGAAAKHGEISTGLLKAAGSLGLALLAMSYLDLSDGRWLLAAGVLVLATHFFNLLDLRPGRSLKAFLLLGAGLVIGSTDARPLWSLGLFAGGALVAGFYDRRGRVLARQGHRLGFDRTAARRSGADGGPAEVRSLHQRGPRHDVPLPARGGVRHRGRRRGGPRSRPLRALHRCQHEPRVERHRGRCV